MVFQENRLHKNRLMADDSRENTLVFPNIGKDVAKVVVFCSCERRFKG